MPTVSTSIKLDSRTCIIPDASYQALGAHRKANGYWCPVGPMPGRAWVLMLREDVATVAAYSGSHSLQFSRQAFGAGKVTNTETTTLTGLYFEKAERLGIGGTNDANAVYLVELADKRILAQKFSDTGVLNVNCRSYANSLTYLLGSGTDPMIVSPHTWQTLCDALWNTMSSFLGTAPTLPYSPHGAPDDFRWWGQNAWEALHEVLAKINCTTAYNPIAGTFAYVQIGAAQAMPTDVGVPLWDGEPFDSDALNVPHTIRVYFPVHRKSYGQERDTEVNSNWSIADDAAVYKIDTATGVSGAVAGTVLSLWDDLPRVLDEDNTVTNASALAARAAERVAKWLTENQLASSTMHRVYDGAKASLLPGSLNKAVCWRHWGDDYSTVTEVVRHVGMPAGYENGHTLWTPGENLRAPDVARSSYPNFPRLPNIVQVWDGEHEEGYALAPNGDGLFPARVRRWVAGDLAELETVWLRIAPENPDSIPIGACFAGRLSGMETSGSAFAPLYLAAWPDITTAIAFKAVGSFTNLESNGPLSSNCAWSSVIDGGSGNAEIDGGDAETLIINRPGIYRVSYTHNRTIDPVFVTLEDDNALHWNLQASLSINPAGNFSQGTVSHFEKFFYWRYDGPSPTGSPISGENRLYIVHLQLCLASTFLLYIAPAALPYALTAELAVDFLVREDNGTNVSIFNGNPTFELEFNRVADWEP